MCACQRAMASIGNVAKRGPTRQTLTSNGRHHPAEAGTEAAFKRLIVGDPGSRCVGDGKAGLFEGLSNRRHRADPHEGRIGNHRRVPHDPSQGAKRRVPL